MMLGIVTLNAEHPALLRRWTTMPARHFIGAVHNNPINRSTGVARDASSHKRRTATHFHGQNGHKTH